jgi:hypothetical protein
VRRQRKDWTGQRFGKLVALEYVGNYQYLCQCDCGKQAVLRSINFTSSHTTSCGCRKSEHAVENCARINAHPGRPNNLAAFIAEVQADPTRHWAYDEQTHTAEYRAYRGAKRRCTDPTGKWWQDYGGRGIEFRFTSFEQWLAELGPKPSPGHSVDRKDNDGHYEPGNVRWATRAEQNKNQRPRKAHGSTPLSIKGAS